MKEEKRTIILQIPISDIEPDENQPRTDITSVGELASSILKEGLIQPIEVRKLANDKYKIVDGERRYSAFKLLKKEKIDCIVYSGKNDIFIRQLVSDFHKEKLDLVEQSNAIEKLLKQGLFIDEIRLKLGIHKSKFYLLKKISKFNDNTKKLIAKGSLTQNILANISDEEIMKEREDEIIEEILSKRAKSKSQIKRIVMSKSDLMYCVNTFLTDQFIFEKKGKDFLILLNKIRLNLDDTIKNDIKNNGEEMVENISLLIKRLNDLRDDCNKILQQNKTI